MNEVIDIISFIELKYSHKKAEVIFTSAFECLKNY